MVLMLKLILGFQPEYLGRTILVAMVASMAFMSVMYFFNICFDKVGSYLMLIFMVLQLGGSAGTYPLELSSDFYHKIHERMPFTYSVKAFPFHHFHRSGYLRGNGSVYRNDRSV